MNKLIFHIILSCIYYVGLPITTSLSQPNLYSSIGKGVNIVAQDSSMSLKFNARIQTLFYATRVLDDASNIESGVLIRRARLKFGGFVFHPNVFYKLELGLSNKDIGSSGKTTDYHGIILDAVMKWKLGYGLEMWAGQTKLPGNRERVISSQNLQFVDRSFVNKMFNLDRDIGLQFRHHFTIGKFEVRELLSISAGEGKNIVANNKGGYDYTGRIEILPFGRFTSKGDYSSADLERENFSKLALAITYDFNDDASREQGQLGDFLPETRDLQSIIADLMFKYKGLSLMGEYGIDEMVGIACDGYGYGLDGSAWGGEVMYCSEGEFKRLGNLMPQPMIGGDLATKYPLRMVAGILSDLNGINDWLYDRKEYFPHGKKEVDVVFDLAHQRNVMYTTSCGRVLDAISALLNICYLRTYEGEPAMKLESLASHGNDVLSLESHIVNNVIDTKYLLKILFENIGNYSVKDLAFSAHLYLGKSLAHLAITQARQKAVNTIGFSGGVAHNELITNTIKIGRASCRERV